MDIRGKRATKASLLALAAVAVGLLGSVQSASADVFTFNPTGSGNPADNLQISSLNFNPGNALAVGALTNGPLTVGETFQVYFQTTLGSVTTASGPVTPAGLGTTYQITEVATLSETVSALNTANGQTTATFTLNPGAASNNVSIYEGPVTANAALGTGFTTGTKIASLSPASFTGSNFTTNNSLVTPFNNSFGHAGNNQASSGISGGGSTGINITVPAPPGGYNPAYFNPPQGLPRLTSSLFNSQLAAVFDGPVNPSLLFTNPTNGSTVAPNIGAINGASGPDIQFQVNAITQSFTVAVPEPTSMTLMGLGVIGALVVARRTRARVA